MTMAAPQRDTDPSVESVWGPSAEIVPFPLVATSSWRSIMAEHARRRDKQAYRAKVLDGNRQRLERIGVSPERIERELAMIAEALEALAASEADAA
jgi:hypothetical protein